MNLQEHIRKVLKEDHSEKMIKLIGKFMKSQYPNFNKEGVDVEEKEFGTLYKYIDKNDPNLLYAKYWNVVKELQLNETIFSELAGLFGDNIEYVIDWFNNEFDLDAEYVTY